MGSCSGCPSGSARTSFAAVEGSVRANSGRIYAEVALLTPLLPVLRRISPTKPAASSCCPRVRAKTTGLPLPSTRSCIFLPNPPQDRPGTWPPLYLSCSNRMLMRPHAGTVHKVNSPLHLTGGIGFTLRFSQEPLAHSLLSPAVEPVHNGLPGTSQFRHVPTRSLSKQRPENPVDNGAIVFTRPSGWRLLRRRQPRQPLPLFLPLICPHPLSNTSLPLYSNPMALQTSPKVPYDARCRVGFVLDEFVVLGDLWGRSGSCYRCT